MYNTSLYLFVHNEWVWKLIEGRKSTLPIFVFLILNMVSDTQKVLKQCILNEQMNKFFMVIEKYQHLTVLWTVILILLPHGLIENSPVYNKRKAKCSYTNLGKYSLSKWI